MFTKISTFCFVTLFSGMAASASAATILEDDFENGNPLTGATVHPNQWYSSSAATTESGGKITVSTPANSGQWSQALYETGVSSSFNIFKDTIKIQVREFSMAGTGVEASSGQNFRLGLMPRDSLSTGLGSIAFHSSGNDGVALSITNGNGFSIRYKADSASNTDPNTTPPVNTTGASSNTFTSTITGFDLAFSSTTWAATFYLADGTTSVNAGTWNLTGFENTWGNATDGFGNAALVMYAQTGNVGSGSVSFTMGSILVTPEPSKGLLILLGGMSILFTRRRKA